MTRMKIAALMFPGFEMLDYYGPLEIFSMFPDRFQITAVAQTLAPQPSSGGPATMPDAAFSDGTAYDLLLIPGGEGTRAGIDNPDLLKWLRDVAGKAQIICSVCTGTALLARAGCLEGHKATTNKRAFDWVASLAPQVDWQRQARWVESGNVFTSSGVSAGIDMALAVVSRLLGEDAADKAALWAEYTRNRNPDDDPFATHKEHNR